jgi:hypothetical protein
VTNVAALPPELRRLIDAIDSCERDAESRQIIPGHDRRHVWQADNVKRFLRRHQSH